MKVGDVVFHSKLGRGIVADFMKRNKGVLVNFSDKHGVRFRWVHPDSLEIIDEGR